MAGGPAKYLVQLILAGSQIVGRAFARALREEIQRSQQAAASRGGGGAHAGDSSRAAAVSSRMGMSVQEAKQILNITEDLSADNVLEKYEHLFKANDKAQGGSFYLQSKVVRAKERLDEELKSPPSTPKYQRNQRSPVSDSDTASRSRPDH